MLFNPSVAVNGSNLFLLFLCYIFVCIMQSYFNHAKFFHSCIFSKKIKAMKPALYMKWLKNCIITSENIHVKFQMNFWILNGRGGEVYFIKVLWKKCFIEILLWIKVLSSEEKGIYMVVCMSSVYTYVFTGYVYVVGKLLSSPKWEAK